LFEQGCSRARRAYPAIPLLRWQFVDGIKRRLSRELVSGPRSALQRPGAAACNVSLTESAIFPRAA